MITEKGKAFIARNFGVNNCYALEDVVSCTVYSKGDPSERVLDTPTIVFLLVTDIVDWVRTSTGRFTLADLVAANEGNYISMSEALDITAYCIPGAAPPTAPIEPLTTPAAKITKAGIITELTSKGAIDTGAISKFVGHDKWYVYQSGLYYKSPNSGKEIKILNVSTRNPPTQMSDIQLLENRTSVSELDSSWVLARLAELPYAAAPVTVPYVPLTTPPGTSKDIEILNPSVTCDSQNCDASFNLKNNSSSGSAYVRLEVDGVPCVKRYVYLLTGATKPQVLSTSLTGLSSGYHNLTIVVGIVTDTDTYTHRFHVGIGIEPPPPTAASLSAPEFIAEIRRRGTLDLARISMIPGDNKWFMFAGQLVYRVTGGQSGIVIINAGKSNMYAAFSKNEATVARVETNWAMARIGELPFTVPPVTPPAAPPATGALPAPTNIRVTYLTSDYAYVEWNGVLDCCSDPDAQREYCACEFGITLNGVSKGKVFTDPYPGTDCEELTPGTRYTLEIQTRSPPNIYTYREPSEKVLFTFTTPIAPLTTPAAKITKAGIITELTSKGAIDTNAVSTVPAADRWYMYYQKLNYHNANFEKVIEISNLQTRNPPTQVADIALAVNRTSVSELDSSWVLARLAELPFKAPVTPPTAASLSAPEFIAEIRRRGTLDLARISMIPGDNKWFTFVGQLVYRVTGGQSGIVIINAGKSNMYAAFSKNEATVARVETNWAMARIGELPFTAVTPPVTPPAAPPVTAVEPPEAIKAWIVRNYGDGTRVTADGWRKLNVAKMANALASLPAGYTGADITEGVVLWAQTNPNWETKTICGWISSIGVTKLTEDHGLYIYNSAVGWTTLADRIYGTLTPKPSKPSAGIVTVDNGLGVYDYAIGWTTIANRITRCNF